MKEVFIMFTYIQIISKDSQTFKGYVDYEFEKDALSITLVRGMKKLHRIIIPFNDITDLNIDKFYGNNRVNFIYDGKKYSFVNTGYGESKYLIQHLVHGVEA